MGKGEEAIGYRVEILPQAIEHLARLDKSGRERISRKIEWLAKNHDAIRHETLTGLPHDIAGLRKRREGDYRILYWSDEEKKLLTVYAVIHRSTKYRLLRR